MGPVLKSRWAGGPGPTLPLLHDTASERKLRLFACACVRRAWALLTDARPRRAVAVAERYADGLAAAEELAAAKRAVAVAVRRGRGTLGELHAAYAACRAADKNLRRRRGAGDAANSLVHASLPARARLDNFSAPVFAEQAAQAALLRDVFRGPFRPAAPLAPHLLARDGGLVVRLAERAYEERELPSGHLDNVRLGVLADALEEAGAGDEELLAHLRSGGPHVRGCWAVDAVLGKS